METELVLNTVARALAFSTPLLWAALGEIYAERSGVVNLGVEGMMIMGAVVGFIVGQTTGLPYLALLAAAGVGALMGLLHAFISITLNANQFVSGLALTIFGLGLSGLLGRSFVGVPLAKPMRAVTVPGLSELPLLGPALFTDQRLLTYAGLIVALILWFVLQNTRLGLTLRAVGESPAAADTAGISVNRVRYLAVGFGGLMAGIAGAYLSLAYRPSWGEGMTRRNGLDCAGAHDFCALEPPAGSGGEFFVRRVFLPQF